MSPRRRWVGRAAVAAWAAAFAWYCLEQGVPFDRLGQTAWLIAGLVAASVSRSWSAVRRIFLDWVPFVVLLVVYDYSRHFAELLGRPVVPENPIIAERLLFGGAVPTVWLQQHLYDPSATHWWDQVGALVYCSHFVAVWVIAALLYLRNRHEWFLWARAVVVLSFAALVTFALVPSAPPWYAAKAGLLPPIERISTRGLDDLHLHAAKQLIDQGAAITNDVAAIPSLHTAFAVLIAIWFVPRVRGRLRWLWRTLLVLYPVAMLAMLVYSGEHYVIDGLVGALYVVGVLVALRFWDRRRARLAAERAGSPAEVVDLDAHRHDVGDDRGSGEGPGRDDRVRQDA